MNWGVNPYPYSYKYITHTKDIFDNFENIKEEQEFTLAGRVMLIRRMGNATFANIIDEKGNMQIFLSKKLIGAKSYEILKLIDVGDIIGVNGTVFKTQTGEITIRVHQFDLLSKSIRTLPEKYHGIQDDDLRQRHRSLDMIMNKALKNDLLNVQKP